MDQIDQVCTRRGLYLHVRSSIQIGGYVRASIMNSSHPQ
jgi:hypothetical protein